MRLSGVPTNYRSLGDLAGYLRSLVASIAAGWNVQHNADGTHDWPLYPYRVTTNSVENSTVETTVLSLTIPADHMANGDLLVITASCTTKNGTAGARTPTVAVKWGSQTVNMTTSAWSNNNTDNRNIVQFVLQRKDADLWVRDYRSTRIPMEQFWGYDLGAAAASSEFVQVISTAGFSTDQSVRVTVTLDNASSSHYWKFHHARAYRVAGV